MEKHWYSVSAVQQFKPVTQHQQLLLVLNRKGPVFPFQTKFSPLEHRPLVKRKWRSNDERNNQLCRKPKYPQNDCSFKGLASLWWTYFFRGSNFESKSSILEAVKRFDGPHQWQPFAQTILDCDFQSRFTSAVCFKGAFHSDVFWWIVE